MTTVSSTTLMDRQIWTGKIFNGDWIAPTGGGQYAVIEPATGTQIGVIGRASLDDVQRAADQAAEAQNAWARTSFNERARVLRRAGQLWEQHAAEIGEWLIRESGSTPPKAAFEQHMTPIECYDPMGTSYALRSLDSASPGGCRWAWSASLLPSILH
jgi:benzaldehyde dehydrogenase (NAD)